MDAEKVNMNSDIIPNGFIKINTPLHTPTENLKFYMLQTTLQTDDKINAVFCFPFSLEFGLYFIFIIFHHKKVHSYSY